MNIMIVDIHIKPECVDAFIEATKANARGSIQEAGVARFDVVQDTNDATHFQLIEVYRNEEALPKHKETAHFATWAETTKDMFATPRTRVFYRNCFPEDQGWG